MPNLFADAGMPSWDHLGMYPPASTSSKSTFAPWNILEIPLAQRIPYSCLMIPEESEKGSYKKTKITKHERTRYKLSEGVDPPTMLWLIRTWYKGITNKNVVVEQ